MGSIMRELKFRLRNEDTKTFEILNLKETEGKRPIDQFTGENDCNGKEIYEGDNLEVSTNYHYKGTVIWERGSWMIDFGDKNDKFPFTRLLSNWAADSTITGHIYE